MEEEMAVEQTQQEEPKQNALSRAAKFLEIGIARGCGWLAGFVSMRPGRTIGVSVFVCLVCAIGWINIDDEQQVEKLYTPQGTRAFNDREWVEDRFGDSAWPAQVYLNREKKDTNLFDKEALLEAFDLYDFVLTIASDKGRRGFDERSCEAVYWRREGVVLDAPRTTCQKDSILAFWDYNRTKLEQDPDVIATINREDKVDCCSPSSEFVSLSSVAGKFRRDDPDDPTLITGAGALRFVFWMETHLNRKSRDDPNVLRLMNKFSRRLRDKNYVYFRTPLPATVWDFSESADEAFDTDRIFINFAIIIIIVYAWVAMSSLRDRDRSRGTLGLASIACVVLSTVAAFGIAIGSGVTFSPSTGVAIFLVLGIGLDDSFVIVGAVDDPFEEDADYDIELSPLENDARRVIATGAAIEDVAARRIVHTLAGAGPSITVTSITDAAAFIAGSFVDTPDISAFNRFCAISVLVDFVMQLTFFVALFTFDQRRRLRGKVAELRRKDAGDESASGCSRLASCCRCVTVARTTRESRVVEEVADEYDENAEGKSSHSEDPAKLDKVALKEAEEVEVLAKSKAARHPNPAVYFWGHTYARVLLSPLGKVFVLSSFVTLLALAIVGVSRIEMDIEDNWGVATYPALRALRFEEKHFGSGTMQVGLYTKRFDYFEKRDAFYELLDDYAGLNFVVDSSLEDNWYSAYDSWLDASGRANANYSQWLVNLRTFLDTDEGSGYATKVILDDEKGVVAAQVDSSWTRVGAWGGDGKRRMRKARDEVRGTPLGTVIVYEADFIWNESFVTILLNTVRAIVGAAVTVLIILLLLLGNVIAALMVATSVAFVCICTLGAVYWYNDGLNYITSFFIVIAVGLSADAPAHVMRAYLDSRAPTRQERAREALEKLGPSVWKGGISTILGIVITGATLTYVFQVFFRYLMTILILALYCGLAVMPVVCSLCGAMPTHELHYTTL